LVLWSVFVSFTCIILCLYSVSWLFRLGCQFSSTHQRRSANSASLFAGMDAKFKVKFSLCPLTLSVYLLHFTLRIPLSPRLLASRRVSILGQRTLSEGTILRCGPSCTAHHIGTCLKRSSTTSADWLHTTLCSYGSGSAMTMHVRRSNSKPGCRTVGSYTSALSV